MVFLFLISLFDIDYCKEVKIDNIIDRVFLDRFVFGLKIIVKD